MRDYSGLEPRTRVLCMAMEATMRRTSVEDMTVEQIQQARAEVPPAHRPVTWITGPVDPGVGITFGTAPARDGYEIPLRIYRPRAVRDSERDVPVIVFVHGGGWVLGNPPSYDPLCTLLAAQVRAVVVSVDYRLAPEHPAPRAAYDCIDATRWIAAQGEVLRADTGRLAVCGDSAGGNLAAVVAQQLHRQVPIAHQALIYPATDVTLSSDSLSENALAPILNLASVHAFRRLYLQGSDPQAPWFDDRDPLVSPLFGELTGLPPALVQTADLDPIRDDGTRYAEALERSGVPVRCTNYLRVPHGFASFPGGTAVGRQQRAELVDELRRHLRGTGHGTASWQPYRPTAG